MYQAVFTQNLCSNIWLLELLPAQMYAPFGVWWRVCVHAFVCVCACAIADTNPLKNDQCHHHIIAVNLKLDERECENYTIFFPV